MSDGSSTPDVVTVAAPGPRTEPHKPRRAVLLVSAAAIALAATAGAVFGFATGTNPSLAVIIQAEEKEGEMVWTYRPVHMTSYPVELEYDGKQIWQDAGQAPNAVSTWGYYFSFREASIK